MRNYPVISVFTCFQGDTRLLTRVEEVTMSKASEEGGRLAFRYKLLKSRKLLSIRNGINLTNAITSARRFKKSAMFSLIVCGRINIAKL